MMRRVLLIIAVVLVIASAGCFGSKEQVPVVTPTQVATQVPTQATTVTPVPTSPEVTMPTMPEPITPVTFTMPPTFEMLNTTVKNETTGRNDYVVIIQNSTTRQNTTILIIG